MSAYNAINGTFSSENHWLLTELLRDEWGFDGLVVSDWGAIKDRVEALKAGLDLEMPGTGDEGTAAIIEAVRAGRIDCRSRRAQRSPAGHARRADRPARRRAADVRCGRTPRPRTARGCGIRRPPPQRTRHAPASRRTEDRRPRGTRRAPAVPGRRQLARQRDEGRHPPRPAAGRARRGERRPTRRATRRSRPAMPNRCVAMLAPRRQRPTSPSSSSDCTKRTSPKDSTGSTSICPPPTSR